MVEYLPEEEEATERENAIIQMTSDEEDVEKEQPEETDRHSTDDIEEQFIRQLGDMVEKIREKSHNASTQEGKANCKIYISVPFILPIRFIHLFMGF